MNNIGRERRVQLAIATLCLICLIIAVLLYFIFSIPPQPMVAITFVRYTNGSSGERVGLWNLSNSGECAVQISRSSTVYWNALESSNEQFFFFPLPAGVVLRHGQGQIFTITAPTNAAFWRTDFAVTREPDLIQRTCLQVSKALPFQHESYAASFDAVHIFLGPKIPGEADTNSTVKLPVTGWQSH